MRYIKLSLKHKSSYLKLRMLHFGWVTSWEVFPNTHEWDQSALERLELVCGASVQSPWAVTSGLLGQGVTNSIRATLWPWMIMCSMHLAGKRILKLRSSKDVVFLSWGECDSPDLTLKRIYRLHILTRCIFFSR